LITFLFNTKGILLICNIIEAIDMYKILAIFGIAISVTVLMTMSMSSLPNIVPNVYAQGATNCAGTHDGSVPNNVYTCSTVGPNPSITTGTCDDGCGLFTSPTTHQQAGRETGQIQETCHTDPAFFCRNSLPGDDG
jgi:hypothetical protein